jgi:hypothetical protein
VGAPPPRCTALSCCSTRCSALPSCRRRAALRRDTAALSLPQWSPLGTQSSWEATKPTSLRCFTSACYHRRCCCRFAARRGIAIASRTVPGSLSCRTAHHPHAHEPGAENTSNPSREPRAPIPELTRAPVRAPPKIAAHRCRQTHAGARRCVRARWSSTRVPKKPRGSPPDFSRGSLNAELGRPAQ